MPSGVPRIPSPAEWVVKKQCTRCGETKPWAKFPPRKYWPDGTVRRVASHCSKCDSEMTLAYQQRMRLERGENFQRYEARRAEWQRRKRAALRAEQTSGGVRLPSGPICELLNRAVKDTGDWTLLGEQCGMTDR